jgi:hypothetical protein
VTLRLFETVGSATLVALTVTFDEEGATAGALYVPLLETVPMVELPPVTPLTLQTTEVFELPVTVAEYCADAPSTTVVGPLRVSTTLGSPPPVEPDGADRATVRLWKTVESALLVAVIVTFDEFGAADGAV